MITDVINVFSCKFVWLYVVNQSTDLFGVSLGVAKLIIICNSQMRKYKYFFVFIETVWKLEHTGNFISDLSWINTRQHKNLAGLFLLAFLWWKLCSDETLIRFFPFLFCIQLNGQLYFITKRPGLNRKCMNTQGSTLRSL
jgi:hypothetical protein